jgi:hypothetical protein
VRRVALKSVEMPISFGQTRSGGTYTNTGSYFAIKIDGTEYSFTMSSRTYDSIDTFITDFNSDYTTFVGTPSGKGGALSVYTETGASGNQHFLRLTLSSSATVVFIDNPLSRVVLGFRADYDSGTATIFGASGRYNLNYDNFISMYIPNIPNSSTSVSSKPMTFKIPLDGAYGTVLYYNDNGSGFQQWIDVPAHYNYCMDRLTVSMYDRFGYNINPWGGDFSFTLAVDYDEE